VPHKYHAKKKTVGDITFDSILEADLFGHLMLLSHAGEISLVERQPKVYLTTARILYKPDFSAIEVRSGERIWFEAKGFETAVWRLKLRLWKAGYGPGRLRIYKRAGRGIEMTNEITPQSVK
jgi:hypothetical protein